MSWRSCLKPMMLKKPIKLPNDSIALSNNYKFIGEKMQLGLRNRLRLISLLPILILFTLASYYVYNAYVSYKGAGQLQVRLEGNKQLNDLINNLSRERGMTVMYMGNASAATLKSLHAQRTIVDQKVIDYQKHLATLARTNAQEAAKANDLSKLIITLHKEIVQSR